MSNAMIETMEGATLLGGGEVGPGDLAEALSYAPTLLAADSGARVALDCGLMPRAVIGDMDSLLPEDQARLDPGVLHRVAEQDTTDFEKLLDRLIAPFALGVGFLGLRVDHQLANLNALVRYRWPIVLLGAHDVVFAAPPRLDLPLPPGTRVSLFPLAPVTGRSEGLHWPIEGLAFAPDRVHGTSNRMQEAAERLVLEVDAPGMLVVLPRAALPAVLTAVTRAARWPSPAPAPAP